MYKDYLDAIVRYYGQKKKSNELSSNLLHPTPGKLRDECIAVYNQGVLPADIQKLRSFFEVHDQSDLLPVIKKFDLDKFRPLANYIKGQTTETEDKNMELLAWLLNFPNRPYDDGFDYEQFYPIRDEDQIEGPVADRKIADEEYKSAAVKEVLSASPRENDDGRKNVSPKPKWKRGVVALLLVGAGSLAYFSNGGKVPFGSSGPITEECMVWVNDHYEQISCDSSAASGLVIGMDENVLRKMRRITRTDTITANHIGRIWYKKRTRDSLDYFTLGGRDPVDLNRDLNRLTKYMFEKYLGKNAKTK